MHYQPTHDWIVAKKDSLTPADPMPKIGGLYRPGNALNVAEPHHFATVIAVGPGRPHPQTGFVAPLPCKVGDVIMVRKVAGDPETIDGREYHWFEPNEVLAVVPPRQADSVAA